MGSQAKTDNGGRDSDDGSAGRATGQKHSGEGAGSAMEAMLKKRQTRVAPPPGPAAPTTQQGGKAGE